MEAHLSYQGSHRKAVNFLWRILKKLDAADLLSLSLVSYSLAQFFLSDIVNSAADALAIQLLGSVQQSECAKHST